MKEEKRKEISWREKRENKKLILIVFISDKKNVTPNVHTKYHTPTTIPSGMIINEDGIGRTDRQTDRRTHRRTYTGGAHLKKN